MRFPGKNELRELMDHACRPVVAPWQHGRSIDATMMSAGNIFDAE
jgi:hypothetical protein